MNMRKSTVERVRPVSVSAQAARDIAADFLLTKVGNLCIAGEPGSLRDFEAESFWPVPILLGNVREGLLGEIGELLVDAGTGEVRFTEQQREELEARANELHHAKAL